MAQKKTTKKRLDGKTINVTLTREIEESMLSYCRQHGVESQSEYIRQAMISFPDRSYDDDSIKLAVLKDVKERMSQIRDMLSVMFSYLNLMHLSLLAYHSEIPKDLKEAAHASAQGRHDKFFTYFKKRLQDDPAFLEKLMHDFVTGSLNG